MGGCMAASGFGIHFGEGEAALQRKVRGHDAYEFA
jgi:hypothetical protein